ncbi:hypothetical protein LSAT2_027838 [Lamellibrachia satsuma]|nr:hypothetical protein LSAT2_027838 [Lamellibrachia satsuma]
MTEVGATVLFDCAKAGLLDILRDLLNGDICLETRDISGNTALHGCASVGQTDASKMLLHVGARVNTRNDNGNTALHNAVIHNRCATAICLLNHGAEHGVANNAGQSPLYMALLHKCRAVARLLHATGGKLTPREVDMYQTYEARRYEEKQDFLNWALHEFNTPPSLGNICRVVIRHCLAKSKCLGKTVEALHGNACTKWSPVSQTMFLRADSSRRVHGGERESDKRD